MSRWARSSPISYETHQRFLMSLRPGWVHENERHVNHSLRIAVDALAGREEDGRLWLTLLFWPDDGTALTAEGLFAAVTSLGSKPGGRCRARVVEHETGALGVEIKSLVKGQPGPKPALPVPISRDGFARLLSVENGLRN